MSSGKVDPVHVLRGHFGEVQCLSFLSDEHLVTGDSNGEVRVWDLGTCRADQTVRLHDVNAGVLQLVCLPQHEALLSQGRDGCIRLWALGDTGAIDRQQPLHELQTGAFNFCRCAVWNGGARGAGQQGRGPAGQSLQALTVASAAHDPSDILLWRPGEAPGAALALRQSHCQPRHGMCMALAFLPPWTPATGGAEGGGAAGAAGEGAGVAAEAGGARGAGASAAGAAHRGAGADESSASCTPSSGVAGGGGAGAAACGAGGADPWVVVAGYEDGVVALWELRAPGRPLAELRVHAEPVMCVDAAVHPGKGGRSTGWVVSGAADDQLGCCTVHPGEPAPLRACSGSTTTPSSGTTSSRARANSRGAAAARPEAPGDEAAGGGGAKGGDGALKLREQGLGDVRIRPDGKLLACGGWDGRVRLFSLRKREPLAVLKYHRAHVTGLAFSPGRQLLATCSRDTTVALWDVYAGGST